MKSIFVFLYLIVATSQIVMSDDGPLIQKQETPNNFQVGLSSSVEWIEGNASNLGNTMYQKVTDVYHWVTGWYQTDDVSTAKNTLDTSTNTVISTEIHPATV